MRQYIEIKENNPSCILFFRLGDFYEMFFEDAELVSKELQLTLTARMSGNGEKAPMCGVPYHAADAYIARLVKKGYKIAICEQMQTPEESNGKLVEREIVRVITPGTVLDEKILRAGSSNYILSITQNNNNTFGLAYSDISTGELSVLEVYSTSDLENEVVTINPVEIIMPTALKEVSGVVEAASGFYISYLDTDYYKQSNINEAIFSQFGIKSLLGIGISEDAAYVNALGALLIYIRRTQRSSLGHIVEVHQETPSNYMSLDKSTMRSLELIEPLYEADGNYSLVDILDKTKTSMGARLLRSWLKRPLKNLQNITKRHDAIEKFVEHKEEIKPIRKALGNVYDFKRICGRIGAGRANARDLISMKLSLMRIPELKSLLTNVNTQGEKASALLNELYDRIDDFEDVSSLIENALVDEPPITITEGEIIKDGFDEELDSMKRAIADGKAWIAGLENTERERTGIKALKVGYNKVFGYYLEVRNASKDLVPDEYIRKQTLVNAERYITPKLKEVEAEVLGAQNKINKREYDCFQNIRDMISERILELMHTADAIAEIDVLAGLAKVAIDSGYTKPNMHDGKDIEVVQGRHPVVEAVMEYNQFTGNNFSIDADEKSLLLITGPNMAGKSTYMRQNALIVLMSQIGSFIPAESANIGIVDRIFTRIGAGDNLAKGQSTFFLEMSELAYILKNATDKSFVILDEIGRGTSTYDGLSIAYALCKFLLQGDNPKVRTLFATHYHELSELEGVLPGLLNLTIAVFEKNGKVIFSHKIKKGSAEKSYGVDVAKLAGVPDELLRSAKQKLKELEFEAERYKQKLYDVNFDALKAQRTIDDITDELSINAEKLKTLEKDKQKLQELKDRLMQVDIMNVTPAEAISLLARIKEEVISDDKDIG